VASRISAVRLLLEVGTRSRAAPAFKSESTVLAIGKSGFSTHWTFAIAATVSFWTFPETGQ
jgi:hypothetical protein